MLLVLVLMLIIILISSTKLNFIIKVKDNKHCVYLNIYIFRKLRIYSVEIDDKKDKNNKKNIDRNKRKDTDRNKDININKSKDIDKKDIGKNKKYKNKKQDREKDKKRGREKNKKENKTEIYNKLFIEIIKRKKYKLEDFYLKIDVCTMDPVLTAYFVATISSFIGIATKLIDVKVNANNFHFKINPIYTNRKILNIKLKCIISISLVHIISIFLSYKKHYETLGCSSSK